MWNFQSGLSYAKFLPAHLSISFMFVCRHCNDNLLASGKVSGNVKRKENQ
jgi:hypothetical protein